MAPALSHLTRWGALLVLAALVLPARGLALEAGNPRLESGFRQMYELRFGQARADFSAYQQLHPGDPLAQAAQAATYLYQEFARQKVFTFAFFLDDKTLLHGIPGLPDQELCGPFLRLDAGARHMAEAVLQSNPRDPRALFALTMADGMMADYDALVAKEQISSLRMIRRAREDSSRLLAVEPHDADAYVAIGAENYIQGCLPGYKRAILWFGGMAGSRAEGMSQLRKAAADGHYLKPLAQVLLALASLREHQPEQAENLFLQLSGEFPHNALFAEERSTAEKMAGRQ